MLRIPVPTMIAYPCDRTVFASSNHDCKETLTETVFNLMYLLKHDGSNKSVNIEKHMLRFAVFFRMLDDIEYFDHGLRKSVVILAKNVYQYCGRCSQFVGHQKEAVMEFFRQQKRRRIEVGVNEDVEGVNKVEKEVEMDIESEIEMYKKKSVGAFYILFDMITRMVVRSPSPPSLASPLDDDKGVVDITTVEDYVYDEGDDEGL